MKRPIIIMLACLLALLLTGGAHSVRQQPPGDPAAAETGTAASPTAEAETDPKPETDAPETAEVPQAEEDEEEANVELQMFIDGVPVAVAWEDNEAVSALQALCRDGPLTISMSTYGGFEQVGSLGARLPSDDKQTTTAAGDIVLYSSSQLVVFYGSNSWVYTRLGHITDPDAAGMAQLLGNGDVTVTIRTGDAA